MTSRFPRVCLYVTLLAIYAVALLALVEAGG